MYIRVSTGMCRDIYGIVYLQGGYINKYKYDYISIYTEKNIHIGKTTRIRDEVQNHRSKVICERICHGIGETRNASHPKRVEKRWKNMGGKLESRRKDNVRNDKEVGYNICQM